MKKTWFLLILFLLPAFAGCRKNISPVNDQRLLFQMDYVNYAWGFRHSGFMIDGDGNILTYDNPEKWNFPDANFILTEDEVNENLALSRRTGQKIKAQELSRYSAYIDNISQSKISALKNSAADAGTIQFICYKQLAKGTLKGSLIRMEGDFTCENLNFYSRKVVTWMKEINTSVNSGR